MPDAQKKKRDVMSRGGLDLPHRERWIMKQWKRVAARNMTRIACNRDRDGFAVD